MSIEVSCPHCAARHQVNERLAGRQVRCPQCSQKVTVPVLDAAVSAGDPHAAVGDPLELGSQTSHGRLRTDRYADPVPAAERPGFRTEKPVAFPDADPVIDHSAHTLPTQPDGLPPSMRPDSDEDEPPRRQKRKEEELDMTPMVDVTFLLLIFFMVTASFSLQKSIEMPRQQTDQASSNPIDEEPEEKETVTVQIDEYGSFLVLAADWERETPGKQNLIRALKEAIGESNVAVRLAVEVHESAKLQALVDVMDAGTVCGYAELQVTQVEGFD